MRSQNSSTFFNRQSLVGDINQAQEQLADGYVCKPYKADELLSMIRLALSKNKLRMPG